MTTKQLFHSFLFYSFPFFSFPFLQSYFYGSLLDWQSNILIEPSRYRLDGWHHSKLNGSWWLLITDSWLLLSVRLCVSCRDGALDSGCILAVSRAACWSVETNWPKWHATRLWLFIFSFEFCQMICASRKKKKERRKGIDGLDRWSVSAISCWFVVFQLDTESVTRSRSWSGRNGRLDRSFGPCWTWWRCKDAVRHETLEKLTGPYRFPISRQHDQQAARPAANVTLVGRHPDMSVVRLLLLLLLLLLTLTGYSSLWLDVIVAVHMFSTARAAKDGWRRLFES